MINCRAKAFLDPPRQSPAQEVFGKSTSDFIWISLAAMTRKAGIHQQHVHGGLASIRCIGP
jgi:hypothetical protein